MLPRTLSLTLATADADGVAQSQTPAGAGNLTLNGALAVSGVAIFDVARRVLVTTAGDESGKTLTITGTDRDGNTQSETVTGPNASTTYTQRDFKTVTQVAVSAAFANTVTVGTNSVGSTRWIYLNHNAPGFEVGVQAQITSGSLTYTVEKTQSDIMGYHSPGKAMGVDVAPGIPLALADQYLTNMGVSGETLIVTPCRAVRATILTGTGTLELIVTQSGGR